MHKPKGRKGVLISRVRAPIANLEAESAVLGGILLDSSVISEVIQDMRPFHFYRDANGNIFQAMLNLHASDEPIDHITVAAQLEKMGCLENCGGRTELARLQEDAITSRSVAHYASIVLDQSQKREIIKRLRKGLDETESQKSDWREVLNDVTRSLFDLAIEDSDRTGVEHVAKDAIGEAKHRLYAAKAGKGIVGRIPYPWPEVDKIIPFRPGEVTVIAGRPSMGKSACALNIASFLAIKKGIPVGIFSLEMPTQTLVQRMAAEISTVSTTDIERGTLSDDDLKKVVKAYDVIGNSPLYLDDTPNLDETTLIAKARAAKFNFGIQLFIIDYLGLMEGKGNSDNERIGGCAKTIRKLARHLRTPFIEVCQLSRAVETRPNRRPILSDFRDSGNVEQEADIGIGLYRDDYYNKENSRLPGQAEFIVLKHRNGAIGTVNLYFNKHTTTFHSLENRYGGNSD